MRDDQIARLEDMSGKLVETFLEEADPETWPGAGKPLADIDQQTRGDRYWCKKNAAATLSIVARIRSVITQKTNPYGDKPTAQDDDDLEKEIAAATREAEKRVAIIQANGKASRRTH